MICFRSLAKKFNVRLQQRHACRTAIAVIVTVALVGWGCESRYKGPPIRHLDSSAQDQPIPIELTTAPPARDPVLGQGDEIEIQVFRQEELTRQMTIPPSHVISYPMVGEIAVEGMTARDLQSHIAKGLEAVVKDPHVTVRTLVARNQNYMVLGEVARPGEYATPARTTAFQAVVRAGGFTQDARRQVVLIRPNGQKAEAYILDLARTLKQGDMRANVVMAAGDILYVPASTAANVDRFANHVMTWLSPVLGAESAVILGDEIVERLEGGGGDSGVVIGPGGN